MLSSQMITEEFLILKALQFHLNRPNPLMFLRRLSTLSNVRPCNRLPSLVSFQAEHVQHRIGKFIMHSAALDATLAHIRPSHLAAAATWISRALLRQEDSSTIDQVWVRSRTVFIPTNLPISSHQRW